MRCLGFASWLTISVNGGRLSAEKRPRLWGRGVASVKFWFSSCRVCVFVSRAIPRCLAGLRFDGPGCVLGLGDGGCMYVGELRGRLGLNCWLSAWESRGAEWSESDIFDTLGLGWECERVPRGCWWPVLRKRSSSAVESTMTGSNVGTERVCEKCQAMQQKGAECAPRCDSLTWSHQRY